MQSLYTKQLLVVCLFVLSLNIRSQKSNDLTTYWEKSGYLETPRYEQAIEFCKKLDEASPWISYETFGVSPQSRDLPLMILDKNGYTTAEEIRKSKKLVVLIQACVHAGESEGKDAGFKLFRDIIINKENINPNSRAFAKRADFKVFLILTLRFHRYNLSPMNIYNLQR
jgi:hypothetical protein